MLLGLMASGSISTGPELGLQVKYFDTYLQDDWRASNGADGLLTLVARASTRRCGQTVCSIRCSGPHYDNWDLSVLRSFKFTERVSPQFRAEMFNAFNRVNF
jgi:hypothetical protein